MNPLHGGWLIALTLLAALLFAAFNLPPGSWPWLAGLRPCWAMALFFFWAHTAPGRIGMFSAFCIGLLFDALQGGTHPFGIHGIGFAFAVFASSQLRERLRLYNVAQRALVLLAVATAVDVVTTGLRVALLGVPFSWLFLTPALATAAVYPLLEAVLAPAASRFVGDQVAVARGRW